MWFFFSWKRTEIFQCEQTSCTFSLCFLKLLLQANQKECTAVLGDISEASLFLKSTPSPFKVSSAAQLETKSSTHTSGSSFPLRQIGFWCPECGVVRHVIMSSEQLHFWSVTEKTPTNHLLSDVLHLKSCQISSYFIPCSHTAFKKQTTPVCLTKLWLVRHLSGRSSIILLIKQCPKIYTEWNFHSYLKSIKVSRS